MQDGAVASEVRYPAGRYSAPARLLHWLVAILVLAIIAMGLTMGRVDAGPLQDWLFFLHEACGFTVLVLMLIRLAWRFAHPPPPLPAILPGWQRGAAHAVHWLLYLALIAQPIIGWLGASAYGAPVSIFGLFTLPMPIAKNEPLSKAIFAVHENLAFLIIGLLVLHFGALLMHGLVKRDGVVSRMWPP